MRRIPFTLLTPDSLIAVPDVDPRSIAEVVKPGEKDPDEEIRQQLFDLSVITDGPRVAAWIVGAHRVRLSLHRVGLASFKIPEDRQTPAWFRVGMRTLERRRGWSVSVERADGQRSYLVRWHGWRRHVRERAS